MNDFVLSVGGATPPTTGSSASRSSSARTQQGVNFAELLQAKSSQPVSFEPRTGTDPVKPKDDTVIKDRREDDDRPEAEPAQRAALDAKQQEQPAAVVIQPPANQAAQDKLAEDANTDAALSVDRDGAAQAQAVSVEAAQTGQQSAADLKAASPETQAAAAETAPDGAVAKSDAKPAEGQLEEAPDFAAELEKANEPIEEPVKGIQPKAMKVDAAPVEEAAAEQTTATAAAAAGKNSVQSQSMSALKASVTGITNEQVMQTASKEASAPEVGAAPPKIDPTSLPLAGIETAKTVLQGEIHEPARLAEAHSTEMLQQVMQGIETLVKGRNMQLRMSLHPDELGKIELRLTSGPNGVGVSIKAEQGDTSRLLESQLANLQQALTSAGINLTYVNVGQDTRQTYRDASDEMQNTRSKVAASSAEKDYTATAVTGSSTHNHSATGVDYRI